MVKVDRAQVMAYRVAALGLAARGDRRPGDLAVLDLGVQEYVPGSVRVGLAARTTAELDDDRLLMVWAARGAPHLHRAGRVFLHTQVEDREITRPLITARGEPERGHPVGHHLCPIDVDHRTPSD